MKLIDYTGKLNHHHEYVRVLKKLKQTCQYVEYVLIFGQDDEAGLPEELKDFVILEAWTKKWWGTKSSHRRRLYRIKWSDEVFAYLKQFETFCKSSFVHGKMIAEDTDFGQNDIAFFDDETIPLLFTTTHEGYISIRDDLLKSLSDF